MSTLLLLAIALTGFFAAALGTMVGMGGGTFVVPVLVVALGIDIRAAIAAGAICVVLTSLKGSEVYLKEGMVNMKLAMVLEISTIAAAIAGAMVVIFAPVSALKVIFGLVLTLVALVFITNPRGRGSVKSGPDPYGLVASYDRPTKPGQRKYVPQHVRRGVGLNSVAGLTAGMLGIGGGAVQVPVMNKVMRVPMRAAVATSTFMVGMTALVSALIYTGAGLVDVAVTVPAMAGILMGSQMGSKMGTQVPEATIRMVLIVVLLVLGTMMVADGVGLWSVP